MPQSPRLPGNIDSDVDSGRMVSIRSVVIMQTVNRLLYGTDKVNSVDVRVGGRVARGQGRCTCTGEGGWESEGETVRVYMYRCTRQGRVEGVRHKAMIRVASLIKVTDQKDTTYKL